MKKLFLFLLIIGLSGCGWGGIKATIKFDPINQTAVYEGPKDVDLTMKRKDGTEVIYSGKTESFFEGLLKFLLTKTPDVNIMR